MKKETKNLYVISIIVVTLFMFAFILVASGVLSLFFDSDTENSLGKTNYLSFVSIS